MMPLKRQAAKAKQTGTAASGADAVAAVASRVTAPSRARTVTPCASLAKPSKALPPRMAKPTKTKATNSPAWPAAISLPMANGARAVAAVAADAAGVVPSWKTALPDRSRTNSGRRRLPK